MLNLQARPSAPTSSWERLTYLLQRFSARNSLARRTVLPPYKEFLISVLSTYCPWKQCRKSILTDTDITTMQKYLGTGREACGTSALPRSGARGTLQETFTCASERERESSTWHNLQRQNRKISFLTKVGLQARTFGQERTLFQLSTRDIRGIAPRIK